MESVRLMSLLLRPVVELLYYCCLFNQYLDVRKSRSLVQVLPESVLVSRVRILDGLLDHTEIHQLADVLDIGNVNGKFVKVLLPLRFTPELLGGILFAPYIE